MNTRPSWIRKSKLAPNTAKPLLSRQNDVHATTVREINNNKTKMHENLMRFFIIVSVPFLFSNPNFYLGVLRRRAIQKTRIYSLEMLVKKC